MGDAVRAQEVDRSSVKVEATPKATDDAAPASRRPVYQPPRVIKKRAVSQATLFTGGGPSSGGVIG